MTSRDFGLFNHDVLNQLQLNEPENELGKKYVILFLRVLDLAVKSSLNVTEAAQFNRDFIDILRSRKYPGFSFDLTTFKDEQVYSMLTSSGPAEPIEPDSDDYEIGDYEFDIDDS